ncbi:hypothetical protein VTH06DRAFT_5446 [Thermothelomyces fergusii]
MGMQTWDGPQSDPCEQDLRRKRCSQKIGPPHSHELSLFPRAHWMTEYQGEQGTGDRKERNIHDTRQIQYNKLTTPEHVPCPFLPEKKKRRKRQLPRWSQE